MRIMYDIGQQYAYLICDYFRIGKQEEYKRKKKKKKKWRRYKETFLPRRRTCASGPKVPTPPAPAPVGPLFISHGPKSMHGRRLGSQSRIGACYATNPCTNDMSLTEYQHCSLADIIFLANKKRKV
jgi:hypothetical protein